MSLYQSCVQIVKYFGMGVDFERRWVVCQFHDLGCQKIMTEIWKNCRRSLIHHHGRQTLNIILSYEVPEGLRESVQVN